MENFNKPAENNEAPKNPAEKELSLEEKVEKLEAENQELKDKVKNVQNLLRTISHDLILPMGNIDNFSNLVYDDVKSGTLSKEDLLNFLGIIRENSGTTSKLVKDLLTWARLQQEGIKPKISVMSLLDQISDSVGPLLQTAEGKKINFKNEIPNDVNITADSVMLQTVVRNLSSNAIKFTQQGGNIIISCEKKDKLVEIYVKDDGVGLKEEQIKNIFESLGTTTYGTSRESGTGFGLSICKKMVDSMNGTIKVESEGEGKGSKFIITLPVGEK